MNIKVTPDMEKLLIEKYLSGLTLTQTGKIFNISAPTVRQYLIKNNIKTRNLSESHKGKFSGKDSIHYKGGKPKCLTCGKQLSTYGNKYCREHFTNDEWRKNIGKAHIGFHPRSEFKKGNISKSGGKRGKDSPVWKGGRRVVSAKYKAKRKRELGFIPLNDYFPESEGHHLDKEHVLYIPNDLHKSIYHNIYTGQGMDEINKIAINWYIEYYGLI
jgi:hypothetical protein